MLKLKLLFVLGLRKLLLPIAPVIQLFAFCFDRQILIGLQFEVENTQELGKSARVT